MLTFHLISAELISMIFYLLHVDEQKFNKSNSKSQDHEIEKNPPPRIPQLNSSSDNTSQRSPTKPISTASTPFHERTSLRYHYITSNSIVLK